MQLMLVCAVRSLLEGLEEFQGGYGFLAEIQCKPRTR